MSVIKRRAGRAFTLICLTNSIMAPAAVRAQDAHGLPPAKEILARYWQAVGSDAWKKHKSSRMKATMTLPTGSAMLEVVSIFPSGVAQTVTIPGLGEIKGGYDGNVAWQTNPMQGPRLLSGPEADGLRDGADPQNALRTSPNIVSSETIEKTSMNGEDCYKVKHTWKSGRVETDCYSLKDGLLVATMSKQVSSMGEAEMVQFQSDWKDFDGLKRPTTITQQITNMNIQTVVTVMSFEWDNVDPKELELPPEIKALVKKP
jgi:hypothetical protein